MIFFALIKVHFYSFVSVSNSCCSFLNFIYFFGGGFITIIITKLCLVNNCLCFIGTLLLGSISWRLPLCSRYPQCQIYPSAVILLLVDRPAQPLQRTSPSKPGKHSTVWQTMPINIPGHVAHLRGRFVSPKVKGGVAKRNKQKTYHGGEPVSQSHSHGVSILAGVLFTWSLVRRYTPFVFAKYKFARNTRCEICTKPFSSLFCYYPS